MNRDSNIEFLLHLHNSPSSTLPPPYTKTCPSNKLSRIKPSVKSPTSSATMETTGANSGPGQPLPQGRPRKLPTHPKNNRNTKLPKAKDSFSRSAPTRKSTPLRAVPHPPCRHLADVQPSGRQKRSTFQQTSRTGSDCPIPNITSSLMSLHSLLPPMGSSTRT